MKNILIVDTETTGLSPEEGHQVIEVAAIVYNVRCRTILQQFSSLHYVKENKAYYTNKIDAKASQEPFCFSWVTNAIETAASVGQIDAVVAHNAEFDKKWMESIGFQSLLDKPWICTCSEFKWGDEANGAKKLTEIALNFGVPVVSAHRALTDCALIASCFTKLDDLEKRLIDALQPREIYRANVSFDEKEKAKEAGFVWNSLIKNAWSAKLTKEEANEKALGFSVTKVCL